jgi:hypothetical protein
MYIAYNGQTIPLDVFFLDTQQTIFNRITWIINTLPEYVYIPEQILDNIYESKEIVEPTDLWSIVLKKPNLLQLIEQLENKFSPDTIIKLWGAYYPKELNLIMDPVFNERYKDVLFEVKTINKEQFIRNLNKKRKQFKIDQNTILTNIRNFIKIKEYPFVVSDVSNLSIRITFKSSKHTLYSIFDNLHVSQKIPIIMYNNFYKILKHYTPPLNWNSSDEYIIGKVVIDPLKNEYTDIIIKVLSDNTYFVELKTHETYDTDTILTQFLEYIPDLEIVEKEESDVGSSFAFNTVVDNNVFADILLTTSYISQFVSINDNIKHVYSNESRDIYYANPYDSNISLRATMTRKVAHTDSVFPINTIYINIKIARATDNRTIKNFKLFLSRVITLYLDNYTIVSDFYKLYEIKEVETEIPRKSRRGRKPSGRKTAVQKTLFPKDKIPEIFVSKNPKENYTRKCQKKNQPIIIPENEVEDEKMPVMMFPKQSDSAISTPQYYICSDNVYKYPGLIQFNNALGVAPCCFKTDQRNKPIYKKYFLGEQIPEEKQQQNVYFTRTDKIVTRNNFGYFPKSGNIVNNIGVLFEKINILKKEIIRQGIDKSPNSFLDCVLTALKYRAIEGLSGVEREQFLQNERRNLIKNGIAVLAMQEMYGESISNIEQYIKDTTEYLDPEKVIRLVEHTYNCNILLFTKTDTYPLGELILPRHINGYCRFIRDDTKPSIFVFCHQGSETDLLAYPHCELIIQLNSQDITTLKKDPDKIMYFASSWKYENGLNPIYNYCWKIYDRLASYYYKQIPVFPIPNDLILLLNIRRQYIDDNGKVRLLELGYSGLNIVVETSPLPPFNRPLLTSNKPTAMPRNIILEFMRYHNLEYPEEYTVEDVSQYLEGRYLDVFSIKLYVESDKQMFYPNISSIHTEYITNSKLSRYLTNWILYLFSTYINTNNIQDIDKNSISRFVNQYILVNENFKYDVNKVGDTFNVADASGILAGGRIVCTSHELLKRMVYQLRLLIERDRENVSTFYKKKNMDTYYVSEYDFTTYNNEYIIYYDYTMPIKLPELLEEKTDSYALQTYPPNNNLPYFFKHPLITDNTVVLAQNTRTSEQALSGAIRWQDNGYNDTENEVTIRENIPYYLYVLAKNGNSNVFQVGRGDVYDNLSISVTSRTNYFPIMNL